MPISISYKEAQEIINIACKEWKSELATLWGSDIVLQKEIEIEKAFYKKMRRACTLDQHQLFDKIFGKVENIFSITSYSEVCKQLGEKEIEENDFDFYNYKSKKRLISIAKMDQIERFFNQNWTPNWKNHNEPKWYAYFIDNGNGLVFYNFDCRGLYAPGVVAYFQSEEITKHIVKYFSDIYIECIER